MEDFIFYLSKGSNNPPEGSVIFDSSDHIRFENRERVTGHNYYHRRFVIEKNIEGEEGYTVTMYNLDGEHPFWHNNIQMSPKRMRVISVKGNIVELRGFGTDPLGFTFEDYGVVLQMDGDVISRLQLNMFDRNVNILYLK